jgi:carbon starvation protein
MTPSVFLLAVALLVLVLGYRFYAKFLALGVFRLDPQARTPLENGVAEAAGGPRPLLFAHHLAAIAAGTTIAGAALALAWGWVAAFLWVVVGSVTAAGTYGLAALWLGARHAAVSPAMQAAVLLGARLRLPFFALGAVMLLLLGALSALVAAQLLAAFPATVLAFGLQVALAAALGSARGARAGRYWPSAAALGLIALSLWLAPALEFSGALDLQLGAGAIFSFDAVALWAVLLLVYACHSARLPLARLARAHGLLTALQLALLLAVLFAGLLWLQPPLAAPAFHAAAGAPPLFPWLFLALSSGALAGFHALIAAGVTARQLAQETDARAIGYGAALGDGLLALAVLLACAAGYADPQEWHRHYAAWSPLQSPAALAGFFIERFAYFAAALGLGAGAAQSFGALVIVALCVTTLEAVLRAQKYLLAELAESYNAPRLRPEKTRLRLAAALTGLLALYDSEGRAFTPLDGWWPVYGATNLLLAAAVLLLALAALQRQGRPLVLVAAPFALAAVAGGYGLAAQLGAWWAGGEWGLWLAGAALFAAAGWIVVEGLLVLARAAQNNRR